MFAAALLAGLPKEGFRYLGTEVMVPADSLLNRRSYPALATRFYVTEPSFGNVLRTARPSWLPPFGYDADADADGAGDPGGREIA